jgi:uncharacterized protein YecE (DUF72 family)
MLSRVRVGTAGWSIPGQQAGEFPAIGSHLERYARRLPAVEINSSFYRPHRPRTYERWARSVPDTFQFAAKLPKEITHARRLIDAAQPLEQFLSEVGSLDGKLGPLLVQLPPSLSFAESVASAFFGALRYRFAGQVVCEPRHPTWFTDGVDALLSRFEVARVAADPARVPRAAEPGGWPGLAYHRLHGSPQMYHSAYGPEYLDALAEQLTDIAARAGAVWCIFDNTAHGEATRDALGLLRRMSFR